MATWCRVETNGGPAYGLVQGEVVTVVDGSPFSRYTPTGTRLSLRDARLLVPVVPANFYAVGLNYRAHIEWAASRHSIPAKVPTQADVGYRSPNALRGCPARC